MKIEVGDPYRYEDHIGEVVKAERFLDNDNDWHVAYVVHLPTLPEGQQWLAAHAKEEDIQHERLS